jgi:hypothetical protein
VLPDGLDFRPSAKFAKHFRAFFPTSFCLRKSKKLRDLTPNRAVARRFPKGGQQHKAKYAVKAKNQICPLIRSEHQKSVSNSVECDRASSSQTP